MAPVSESESGGSDSTITIDFSNPLYLHPSDTPWIVLVSHQLTGSDNYCVWSRSMSIALLAKNKLGFIDGSCKCDSLSPDLKSQWDRCSAFVLSWIINTVSKELSAGIVFASSAALVWKDLQERYFICCYLFHRILWDEYDILVPSSNCDCDLTKKTAQHSQQRLFQFFMGLNETYANVRSQILLMQPLPSVNNAYSMVIRDEDQRKLASHTFFDSTALLSSKPASSSSKKRYNGICEHCKLSGHRIENCYRLTGFPPDFKFTKKKSPAANHVVTATDSDDTDDIATHSAPLAPTFTPEQYQQILSLLRPLQWKDDGDW
ncbi:uncharacterized protein [Gossypium hirsutum]|uniref:Retrotransposon Copia-like N-terminal domain-containing protein n=1 Tax=Gossypium hirsutum TaxID=3635 RepID=A0ABM3AZT9_GOSHI|nr:uncharacterized protein LOC107929769 [Gossypium hirsutum]